MNLPISLLPLHSEICESWYCSSLRGSRAHSTPTNLCCAMSVNKNHSESLLCTLSSCRGIGQGEKGRRCVTPWWVVFLRHKTRQVQESLYFFLITFFFLPQDFRNRWPETCVPLLQKHYKLLYHNWSRKSIRSHQIRWEWRGENFN